MALTIISPVNSFIRFNEASAAPYCIWGEVAFCLPVYNDEDVYFQFIIDGTSDEIDALCTTDASEVEISIVPDCNETPLLVFGQKPSRIRLSATQLLYNWQHGFPGFTLAVAVAQCFKAQVRIIGVYGDLITACSNCFERIADDCFTSVIEYGNDEDSFGFKYCDSGESDADIDSSCEPTNVQFIGVTSLSIPYTTNLLDKYGPIPNVQVWIYNDVGELVNMGITAGFDGYPVSSINMDFGGVATGIVTIR